MIFMIDRDDRVVYVNDAAARILGQPASEIVGRERRNLFLDDISTHQKKAIDQVFATGMPVRSAGRLGPGENPRWYDHSLIPVRDESGAIIQVLGTSRDITDQKENEERIRKLAQFPAENPYPVIRYALDGTFLYANDPGKRWLASIEDHGGEQIRGFIHDLIRNVLENDGTFKTESEDASGRLYQITAVRPDGENHINMYIIDITERRDAERAIRETTAKLNLLTSVTRHDVANQITILQGYTQMALMKDPDPVIADFLKKIDAAGNAISRQIEFTRNYQDLGMQKPGWFGAREILEKHAPEGISFSCTCDAEIYADPMLDKVVSNIVDNAVRHGERVTEIRVRCMDGSDGLSLVIEDNGVGVPYDKKEQIFQKGYGKHTGFGLFLSRKILGITGITIHETGVPGKGARFELSIPKGKYRLLR